jgi:signal peptidase I
LVLGVSALVNRDASARFGDMLFTAGITAAAGAAACLANTLIVAGCSHGVARLLRIREARFGKTLRCAAFAQLGLLLGVVPGVGWVLGTIAVWWFFITGLRGVYQLTAGKATLVAFSPVVFSVLAALGLRVFVVEAFKLPSSSMAPSLMERDHVFVSKVSGLPERGSVWVFRDPEAGQNDHIKRVIALPRDEVRVESGQPIINGWKVPRCSVGRIASERALDSGDSRIAGELFVEFLGSHRYLVLVDPEQGPPSFGPFVVPADEYFVLGDNRSNSADSRTWCQGFGMGVPKANLRGHAQVVWLSSLSDGTTYFDRFWMPLDGDPILPPGFTAEHQAALASCLRSRPPLGSTTPPRP